MKCYHCGTELTWGGDHDTEFDGEEAIVTNLSCENCGTYVEVYYPLSTDEKRRQREAH